MKYQQIALKEKMLNVYVEDGHCTQETSKLVLLVTALFDNVL